MKKNNIIKGIIVCLISYMTGRIIGGLWGYTNPEKARKLYNGFLSHIRKEVSGFADGFHAGYKKGYGFGRSLFNSEIPLEQSEIAGREITAEDRAALNAALAETLRKAENLGNVVSLDDLEV